MAKKTVKKSNMTVNGSNAADVITITGSSNRIYAKGGNDKITLNKGQSNYIDAGKGNDTIIIGKKAGDDNVFMAGAGNDNITVSGGRQIIDGGAGADKITVAGGEQDVSGGAGNDSITVSGGNNHTLRGGAGSDKYIVNVAMSKNTLLTIDQSDAGKKDKDVLQLSKVSKNDVKMGVANGTLSIKHKTGGGIIVEGYDKKLSKIQFKDGTMNVSAVQKTSKKTKATAVTWNKGETKTLDAKNIVSELQVTGHKVEDFVATLNSKGQLVLWDANNGKLTISNWKNSTISKYVFQSAGYSKTLTSEELKEGILVTDETDISQFPHTVLIDKNGTYEAGRWNDVFTFAGSGWNATITGADGKDKLDFSQLAGVTKENVQYALANGTLTITTGNGTVNVPDWSTGSFKEIQFAGGGAVTAAEIHEILTIASMTKVDWVLGSHSVFAAGDITSALWINGYKENDFVITRNEAGQLVLTDAAGGTITVDGWSSERELPSVLFTADGYRQTLSGNEINAKAFTVVPLADNEYYDGGTDIRQEFAINVSEDTDIVIDSASKTEDRIRFTNDWTTNNVDSFVYHDKFYNRDDFYIRNWDNESLTDTDGQVVIADFMNSSVKTVEFADQTYHLVTESGSHVGSDTVSDRYVFMDSVKNGSDVNEGDWDVTLAGLTGNDVIDLRFLPNNKRYYSLNGTADGKDMVFTYNYSVTPSTGTKLGTIRLKDFFNDNGTVDTTNGYIRIRTQREFYAGYSASGTFDGWVWENVTSKNGAPEMHYRWLYLNAGTANADTVDLGNLEKPNQNSYRNNFGWLYYAGDGNDTITSHAGDIVYGDKGDDTLNATGRMSDIHGGDGGDTITVRAADEGNLDRVVVRGEAGNDVINAYGSYHYLNGGSGDDIIHIYSAEGSDDPSAHNGVAGSRGNDEIYIHAGDYHRAFGNWDDDKLYLYAGSHNVLGGGDGKDEIHIIDDGTHQSTDNAAYGGNDDDKLYIENGGRNHYLFGDNGNDYLSVDGDNNRLYGDEGNDKLEIVSGDDNRLYGDEGNDTLEVAGGNENYLSGGTGNDEYVISAAFTADTKLTINQNNNQYYDEEDEFNKEADILQLTNVNKSDVNYSLADGTLTITHSSGGTVTVEGWETNPFAEVKFANNESITGDEINENIWAEYHRVEINSSGAYQGTEAKDYFTFNGLGWEATISALNGDDTLDISNYNVYSTFWKDSAMNISLSDWEGEALSSVTLNDSNINVKLRTENGTKRLIAGTGDTVSGTDDNDLIVVTHDRQEVYANGGSDNVVIGGKSYSYWTGDEDIDVEVPVFSGTIIHFSEDSDGGSVTIYGGSGHTVNGNGTDLDVSIDSSDSNTINGSGRVSIYNGSGNTVNSDGNPLKVYADGASDNTVNGSEEDDNIYFDSRGTGNKIYGHDGNDTLKVDVYSWSAKETYVNGGAGNDTYTVDFEGEADEDDPIKTVTVDNSTAGAGDKDKLLICGWNSFTDCLFRIEDGNLEISKEKQTVVIQGWSDHPLTEIGFVGEEEDEATWLTTEQVKSRIDYSTNYIMIEESGSYEATDRKDCFTMAANNLDVSISGFTVEDIISVPSNETVAVSGVDNGDLTLALTNSNSTVNVKDYFNGSGQIQLKSGSETKNLVAATGDAVNGTTGDDLILVTRDEQEVYTNGGSDRVVVGGKSQGEDDGDVGLPVFSGTKIHFSENSDGGSVTIYGGSGHTVNGNGTDLDVRIDSSDSNIINGSGSIRISFGDSNVINGSGSVDILVGSGNTVNSDGNPLKVYADWSEDTTVNGSSGNDVISFEGYGRTGNKVYGYDGNDTLTVNYESAGVYVNGGTGNDTYRVFVEGSGYDEGDSPQKIITVDNSTAGATDKDRLLICGWNSFDDCEFCLGDGNLEITKEKETVVIQGWSDHPLTEIGFVWDEEEGDEPTWLTKDEVGARITLNQVIEISETGTYEGTAGKDTFVFSGSGWNATITGATGKDRLDFSQYTDGTYGITGYSQSDDDLVMYFSKYGENPGDETTPIGTLTMKDYFTAENRLSQMSFYDAAVQTARDYNLTVGEDGGYGNDIILAGNDNGSTLFGDEGNDVLIGGAGEDKLFGSEDNDTIYGGDGTDELYGGYGDDVLYGGAGDDELYGSYGNDVLIGGDGEDELFGSEGNDTLYGGDGTDYLYGDEGDDVLYGGAGTDNLRGGEGNDRLYATAGTDELFGDEGDDTITVSGGNGHVLRGGTGSDTYVVDTAFGNDTEVTIQQWDFEEGDTDVLQLATVNKDDVSYAVDNDTLTITHSSGGTVTVEGWETNPFAEVKFANNESITGDAINENVWAGYHRVEINSSGAYQGTAAQDYFTFNGLGWEATISDLSSDDTLDISNYDSYSTFWQDSAMNISLSGLEGEALSSVTLNDSNINVNLRTENGTKHLIAGTGATVNGTDENDLIVVTHDGQEVYTNGGSDSVVVGGKSYWTEDGETYVELPVFSGTKIHFSEDSDDGSVTIYGGSGHTVNGNGTDLDVSIDSSDSNTINGSGSIRISSGESNVINGSGSIRISSGESNVINGSGSVTIDGGSGNTVNSDGNPLDVSVGSSEDTIVNGSSGNDIISFEGYGGTGNKVYGHDGNDTLTVYYETTGAYVNGGTGNDTYRVIVEGSGYDEGGSPQKIITVDNSTAVATDSDKLLICGWNSFDDCSFYLQDGNLEITKEKETVVIQGWADHPLTEIGFSWHEEDEATWLTTDQINESLAEPEVVTQQSVIKKFMKSLDDNPTLITANVRIDATEEEKTAAINSAINDATAVLDAAVNYASNGKFATWDALTERFISDVRNYGIKDDSTAKDFTYDGVDDYGHLINVVPESGLDKFLKNYCGIDLTNEDTGSIIGKDAGGAEVKTAVSIVPENGTVAALRSPASDTTTINGLTFHWPDAGGDATKQYIIDSLYTWWAKEGLNLVDEAFGLSFEEEGVTGRDMTVVFVEENENFLAKVKSNYQYGYTESGTEKIFTSENTSLTMQINMKYFNSVDTTGVDGYAAESNSYLDRTIAHEFTHAIMAATMERVYGGGWLPLYVTEGLAELVHGIDDFRTTDIISLSRSTNTEFLTTVLQPRVDAGSSSYAAGYMLFRYLARQVAGTVNGQAANESPNVIATPPVDVVGELASASSMLLSDNGVVSSDCGESSLAITSIQNAMIDFANTRIFDSLSGTQQEDKQNSSLFITGNV